MISVSSSGKSFSGLAAYLRLGRSGREVERVDWAAERNLPTDEIELAGKVMRETAAQNRRVEDPLYHFVLSFDRRDQVTRDQMEQVVDRVLAALTLTEHQALLVAHRDRAHAHVHVMVNRIHPETHRAADRWHDMVIMQAALREAERALSLTTTPGRLAVLEPQPAHQSRGEPRGTERPAAAARDSQADSIRTTGRSLLEQARAQLATLRAATSWPELAAHLERTGLWIESHARGAVITDGDHFIRASLLAPDCSGPALAERFGGLPPAAPAHALAKAHNIADTIRELREVDATNREAFDATAWMAGVRHRRELLDAALTKADEAWRAFDRALARLFDRDGMAAKARMEFTRLGTQVSLVAAQHALATEAREVAQGKHNAPHRSSSTSPRSTFARGESIAAATDAGTSALQAEQSLQILSVELRRARLGRGRALPAERPSPDVLDPVVGAYPAQVRDAFPALYEDADRALSRFATVHAARGGLEAVRVLSGEPEQFGSLRGESSGRRESAAAHQGATRVVQGYFEARGQLESERELVLREFARAEQAVKLAAARQRDLPQRSLTVTGLRRMVAGLKTAELAVLNPLLALPERALLRTVRQAAREVALGRSSDVER